MMAIFFQRYERRLSCVITEAQQSGEIRNTLDKETAARLFIAAIQYLVSSALAAGEIDNIHEAAPDAFTAYCACVEATQ